MNLTTHGDSCIYDIDSIIYKTSNNSNDTYTTIVPGNKEYRIWMKWNKSNLTLANKNELGTPFLFFYRKRQGYLLPDSSAYSQARAKILVQYPSLSWYISGESSTEVFKKIPKVISQGSSSQSSDNEYDFADNNTSIINNITLENPNIDLICFKTLQQTCNNLNMALYVLQKFYGDDTNLKKSIFEVYKFVEKCKEQYLLDINETKENNFLTYEEYKNSNLDSILWNLWSSEKENKWMKCYLKSKNRNISLDLLSEGSEISLVCTGISPSDLDEAYYVLARSLAGFKKYEKWNVFEKS